MKTLSYQYNQLSLHEKLDLVPPDANEPGNAALSEKKKLTRKALNFAQKHGLPKRPAHSGFGIYISERLIGAKGKTLADVANKLKELSSIWNLFSSSEKQVRYNSLMIVSFRQHIFVLHTINS
ncbi:unnamed protein product [Protopolystoma xenopodis]|uniref:HMG box domain-containing protein n=1 Tax=Protopolystoma xenopodis TaxID=117903 RepID=A0A3S4ZET4_9PLAT|nr:unnamed protein product [Protopolystoma xenopodis]